MKQHSLIDWSDVHRRVRAGEAALDQNAQTNEQKNRDILRRRAQALAKPRDANTQADTDLTLLAFRIGHERLAIDLMHIAEITVLKHCTTVPGAPPELCGVLCHRGEIRSVIDGPRILGIESQYTPGRGYLIHVKAADKRLLMRADAVEETIDIASDHLARPDTLPGTTLRRHVRGVHASGLIVLDAHALCAASPPPRIVEPPGTPPGKPDSISEQKRRSTT